jgi:nitrogenase subunit NifH
MFLNQIKNFFIQNKIKKSLTNVKHDTSNSIIKTVGIIYDETNLNKREALIKQLITKGIKDSDITTLIFKDKIYKNEIFDKPIFSHKDLSWSGVFENADVNYFVYQKFDLLINYYDVEKLPLLLASNLSKSSFKVGFSEIDKRLNHFIINTTSDKYSVFVDELFKYLKILKKI